MSKSKELSKKYETIRITIQGNLKTIRTLLEQAEALTELIDQTPDEVLKAKLQASVASLYKTIDMFIEESNTLFDQYLDFVNSIAD